MTPIRRAVYGISVGTLAAFLTGCAVDSLIWGNDGAEVIRTTEQLVSDLASGETSGAVCEDSVADLGAPSDWSGLSAGEPEEFFAGHWVDQVALDPQWSINLEGLPEGAVPGTDYPGDVFYRETDDGLCVIDVSWSTLISVN
ncbi:hypothetical protein CQ010_05485 [Arthrobacter sp. MYb211]|uniref:hypothetical protein n=1 Tax=unclassified Arthrobacter TaxID=235627 RepID=UPI000CFDEEB5|nr:MULTISPECIES: hypothetical protein [unclassified Arthrobacter]PRA13979.1 hypothetical protein CQ015_01475 [Arthrobacter sp. MYb221]PRC09350.1 hypothetical protein CQ010_05485 [Arthrobacter sp. MYb211]